MPAGDDNSSIAADDGDDDCHDDDDCHADYDDDCHDDDDDDQAVLSSLTPLLSKWQKETADPWLCSPHAGAHHHHLKGMAQTKNCLVF